MKIDYSKWVIVFHDNFGNNVNIENPSEGVSFWVALNSGTNRLGMSMDDPIKYIKELGKQYVRNYYLNKQFDYLAGKTIPVEDNLDYVENEAEKRGLI